MYKRKNKSGKEGGKSLTINDKKQSQNNKCNGDIRNDI